MADVFRYLARSKQGKTKKGEIKAVNKQEAIRRIKANDLRPIEVEKKGEGFSIRAILDALDSIELTAERVSLKEKYLFCRQLASMLRSGIPIINALKLLAEEIENEALQIAVQESALDIERGRSLSAAFSQHPDVFSKYFVHLVESGEAGGFLDETLNNLAKYFKNKDEKRKKVVSAMSYPAITMTASIIVVLVLMVNVLPNFMESFEQMQIDLPLPTQILMSISDFLASYWIIIVGALIGGIVLLYRFYKTEKGKYLFDTLVLKIPIVRGFILENSLITFSKNLSLLDQSGVDFLQSMKIVNNNITNVVIKEKLDKAWVLIKDGVNITSALREQEIFPGIATRMIQVGEETGELAEKLDNIVDFYQEEVEEKFDNIVGLIEPIMIVFLTFVIGGIVASVILPIFEMSGGI